MVELVLHALFKMALGYAQAYVRRVRRHDRSDRAFEEYNRRIEEIKNSELSLNEKDAAIFAAFDNYRSSK